MNKGHLAFQSLVEIKVFIKDNTNYIIKVFFYIFYNIIKYQYIVKNCVIVFDLIMIKRKIDVQTSKSVMKMVGFQILVPNIVLFY